MDNSDHHIGLNHFPDGAVLGRILEKLRSEWAQAATPEEQKRLAVDVQRVAYEVVPYVITGQYFSARAYRKNVKGYIPSPVPFLWNIDKQ